MHRWFQRGRILGGFNGSGGSGAGGGGGGSGGGGSLMGHVGDGSMTVSHLTCHLHPLPVGRHAK